MRYKALIIKEGEGKKRSYEIGVASIRGLSENEVTIRVHFSSINVFDAGVLNFNNELLNNKYPKIPGIDAAGVVVASRSSDINIGDEVIVTGYSLGVDINGAYGDYVNVPAAWVLKLPMGLTLYEAMAIGTDGLTAALAVIQLINTGLINKENDNDVVVTGGTTGVGTFAVALLNKLGFNVTTVTNTLDNHEYLSVIGAKTVLTKDRFLDTLPNDKLFLDKYVGAVDVYGGESLSRIISSIKQNGSIASCGMLMSSTFTSSIFPLVSRGVNILGIDGINCHLDAKKYAWSLLSGEWKLNILSWVSNEIALDDAVAYSKKVSTNLVKGRIVINHALR